MLAACIGTYMHTFYELALIKNSTRRVSTTLMVAKLTNYLHIVERIIYLCYNKIPSYT